MKKGVRKKTENKEMPTGLRVVVGLISAIALFYLGIAIYLLWEGITSSYSSFLFISGREYYYFSLFVIAVLLCFSTLGFFIVKKIWKEKKNTLIQVTIFLIFTTIVLAVYRYLYKTSMAISLVVLTYLYFSPRVKKYFSSKQ